MLYVVIVALLAISSIQGQVQLGFGTPAPPVPNSFDPHCKDKVDTCWKMPESNCKAPYAQWSQQYCPNRCGYCNGPTTPAPACVNKLPNCESYDKSVCSDPDYMTWAGDNCRYFCRMCSSTELFRLDAITTTLQPKDCLDKVDCRQYGSNACSTTYKAWSMNNCPLHCKYCPGIPTPPPVCANKIPNCHEYNADTCNNSNYRLWVEDNCKKFCGLCTGGSGPATPAPPVPIVTGKDSPTIVYIPPSPPSPGKREQGDISAKRPRRQFHASHHHQGGTPDCWDGSTIDPSCNTQAPEGQESTPSSSLVGSDGFPGSEFKPHPTPDTDWDSKPFSESPATEKTKSSVSTHSSVVTTQTPIVSTQTPTLSTHIPTMSTQTLTVSTQIPTVSTTSPPTQSTEKTTTITPPTQSTKKTTTTTTPPTQSTEKTTTATPPTQSTERTTTITPPTQSTERTTSTTPPTQSTEKTTTITPPTQSTERTTSTTPPTQSTEKTTTTTPPTQSTERTTSTTLPTQSTEKTTTITPPTQSTERTTTNTPPTQSTEKTTTTTPPTQSTERTTTTTQSTTTTKPTNSPTTSPTTEKTTTSTSMASTHMVTPPGATTPLTKPTTDAPCVDTEPKCSSYGPDICTQPIYKPWANAHCKVFCRFCQPVTLTPFECKNKLANCGEYDSGDLCTAATFFSWSRENCFSYCGFHPCGNNTGKSATDATTSPPTQTTAVQQITSQGRSSNCSDKLSNCLDYSDAKCVGIYEPYARSNCAFRCGYCQDFLPCQDESQDCNKYTPADCVADQYKAWARKNCRKYCNLCARPTATLTVTHQTVT